MKFISLLCTLFLLQSVTCFSQNCGSCMIQPRVVSGDLDIQVPKPTGEKEMAKWQLLSSIGKFLRENLSQSNAGCIRFIHPLSISAFQTNPNATSLAREEVCRKADYLITGNIRQSGNGYQLHVELQASCTGNVLISSDLSFHSNIDSSDVIDLAKKAAVSLSPLREKINSYAIAQRQQDRNTALGGSGRDAITIEPKKNNLSAGEETEVEITLKDCDGMALTGRKIDFSSATIEGTHIEGTSGGTVTPAQVITDGYGKAKVKFKMGKDKSAVIRPHTVYKKPSGGTGVMRTARTIPKQLIVVSVNVAYSKKEVTTLKPSSFMSSLIKGKEQVTVVDQDYDCYFDHVPVDPSTGFLVLSLPEKGQERTLYYDESGNYSYVEENPDVSLDTEGGAIEIEKQLHKSSVIKEERKINPQRHASIVFFTGNEDEPMRFDMALNFENETDLTEGNSVRSAASFSINNNTPGAKITVKNITDPKSHYKTEYTIEYFNSDLGSMDQINEDQQNPMKRLDGGMYYTGTEFLFVYIRVPK